MAESLSNFNNYSSDSGMTESFEISRLTYNIPGKLIAAICELNQWALDFEGNYERICESIAEAKSKGATYRLGPELEVCGYNCMDHFNEIDTVIHCYEVLARILANKDFYGIVLDIGMPVIHDGVRYNSRAVCYNGELICIRPKTVLANDGMYHEERWFVGWKKVEMAEWIVPEVISRVIGKMRVPIGVCVLQFIDVSIGLECCEELFVPNSLHNILSMNGAHVICNGNGSHFQIGKINKRFSLVSDASGKTGCTYLYGNLQGCDGSTMYFDGGSFVASSGKIVHMNKRFTINAGVVVLIATIDVNEIRARRAAVVSLSKASAEVSVLPKIFIPHKICKDYNHHYEDKGNMDPYEVIEDNNKEMEDLIGAPCCFLWDYLRRSGTSGFFVPLTGDSNSTVVALLVYYMCEKLVAALKSASSADLMKFRKDIFNITKDSDYMPETAADFCQKILFTAYMRDNQTSEQKSRFVESLTQFINSKHVSVDIEKISKDIFDVVIHSLHDHGPAHRNLDEASEKFVRNSVQARSMLVLSYLFSQLAPIGYSSKQTAPFLVLGISNADEILRGSFTKYGTASGDISPIASLSKEHIFKIVQHFAEVYDLNFLYLISEQKPSSGLVPHSKFVPEEEDIETMGFTYSELTRMREIRSHLLCGPLSMFNRLLDEWGKMFEFPSHSAGMPPDVIAEKVKKFFIYYAMNRHKTSILPPAVHMSETAPDGRYKDIRPFLISTSWNWQFNCIDSWLKNKLKK